MTQKELEQTAWAKEFKADSPVSYSGVGGVGGELAKSGYFLFYPTVILVGIGMLGFIVAAHTDKVFSSINEELSDLDVLNDTQNHRVLSLCMEYLEISQYRDKVVQMDRKLVRGNLLAMERWEDESVLRACRGR